MTEIVIVKELSTFNGKPGAPKRNAVLVAADRPAHERQPGETQAAHAAFMCHLNSGPNRSLIKTAELLGKSYNSVRLMSSRYGWNARVTAWNAMTNADALEVMRERQRNVLQEQADSAATLRKLSITQLEAMVANGDLYGKDLVPLVLGILKDERAITGYADPGLNRGGAAGVVVNVNQAIPATDARLQHFAQTIATWAQDAGLTGEQRATLAEAIINAGNPPA